jgi:Lon protease-like protein
VQAALALAAQLGEADTTDAEISDDPLVATYHLATLAPIGPADRLKLLSAEGPSARLDLLDSILDDVEAMLRFRLS